MITTYIIWFLLFAVIQSMAINGIHLSMEGKEKIGPDGKLYSSGDVLYFIKRELSRANKFRSYIGGEAINSIISYAEVKYGIVLDKNKYTVSASALYVPNNQENSGIIKMLETLSINEGVKYSREVCDFPEGSKTLFSLFIEDTKYKYPPFIRKSIGGGCIKCMASFYGSVTFVPAFIYLLGLRWEIAPALVLDIFVLVFLNYFLYKRA